MHHSHVPFPRAAHDGIFPEEGPIQEQLRFMLNFAVLAPSVMNSQPWRFEVAGREVRLYADRERALPAVDPDGRELVISCGCALQNLQFAIGHYGFEQSYDVVDDESRRDLLAVVSVGDAKPATREEDAFFSAIPRRQTERRPFAALDVNPGLLREMQADAGRDGVRLDVFTDEASKSDLSGLIADAIRLQGQDADAVRDLTAWLRSDDDPRPDGVRDERQNAWGRRASTRAPVEPIAIATEELASESPALLVLSTDSDDRRAWLEAGRALERVLLRGTIHDLSASYLNQATEVEAARRRLAERVGTAHPQVVFRVGHPIRTGGSQRRRVAEVLLG